MILTGRPVLVIAHSSLLAFSTAYERPVIFFVHEDEHTMRWSSTVALAVLATVAAVMTHRAARFVARTWPADDAALALGADGTVAASVHDFAVRDAHGARVDLSRLRGATALIVNVASECGLARRGYAVLAELERRYDTKLPSAEDSASRGPRLRRRLAVLAFPCDQFGGQEPAPACDVAAAAPERFGVTVPVMQKVTVNGPHAAPLYRFLKAAAPMRPLGPRWPVRAVLWNFVAFLVDADGVPVRRFAPGASADDIAAAVDALLDATDTTVQSSQSPA